MANIQDNQSNINEFLSKSLSIFNKHIEYTEQFTVEFKELYKIGQNLQSDYSELVRTNEPAKESAVNPIIDESNDPTLKEIEKSWQLLQRTIKEEPTDKLQTESDTPVISNDNRAFSGRDQPFNREQNGPSQSERKSYIPFQMDEPVDFSNEGVTQDEMSIGQAQSSDTDGDNGENNEEIEGIQRNNPRRRHFNKTKRMYKCDVCDMKFGYKSALDLHICIHNGDRKNKKFNCDICSKGFNFSCYLTRHMRTHTGEKPLKCSICPKRFSHSCALTVHMRSHTGDKPYKCTLCEKGFSQSGDLKKHIMVHTGENRKERVYKSYNCEVCSTGFSQKGNLKQHMMSVHTGDLPHTCTVCNKGFIQASRLKDHMAVHTDDRPFKCSICSKGFNYSSVLKVHMRVHSGDRTLAEHKE